MGNGKRRDETVGRKEGYRDGKDKDVRNHRMAQNGL